jgi:hypothetical protein
VSSEQPAEPLPHNPLNGVTQSIERLMLPGGGRVVRKRIGPGKPGVAPHWQASPDRAHWNWWEREAHAYRSGALAASLAGTGMQMPEANVIEEAAGYTLVLEWVEGTPGVDFAIGDHTALARGLGRWQARPPLAEAWLSHGFLRAYSESKPVPAVDDGAWEAKLVRELWPAGLAGGWGRLASARERLLRVMERLPRATCHLDVWPPNVVRRPSGEVVLLDWGFCGDGALGEDLGNLVPDGVFDLFWPAHLLGDLAEETYTAYVAGLRECGWEGDESLVRLGMTASAVKYTWLLPATLVHARDATHQAYFREVDGRELFAARGAAFAMLVDWADEALRIADRLGW